MSSWEEYKKKNGINQTTNLSSGNFDKSSSQKNSSWEIYKRQKKEEKEEEKKQEKKQEKQKNDKKRQEIIAEMDKKQKASEYQENKENKEQNKNEEISKNITYGPVTKGNSQNKKQSFEERKNKENIKNTKESRKVTKKANETSEPLMSTSSLGNLKEIGTAVKASNDIYSEDSSKSIPATIRYGLDRFKNAIAETPNKILNWTDTLYGQRLESQTEISEMLLKNIPNDALKNFIEENQKEGLSNTSQRIKHRQANTNANQLYSSSLPETAQTIGNLGETVGRMIPTIGLSAINPVLGDVAMFTTSAGDESGRLIDEGYSYKKAGITGGLKGLTEVGTEKITGGIRFRGKGVLDDIVGNTIANKTKGKVSNFLATKGYQMAGEIGEEYISNIAGYGIDKMVLNKDTTLNQAWEDAKETTKMTFLTTLTLNLMGLGGANYSNNKTVNQQFINEYENITKTKLNEEQKSNLLNNVEQIKEEIENGEKLIQEDQVSKNLTKQSDDLLQNETLPVVNEKYRNKNIFNQEANNVLPRINEKGMYVDEAGKENNIYFRFDGDDTFRGKEHQSGIAMWEDRVDELLTPQYDMYENSNGDIDFEMAEREVNSILSQYGLDYNEYTELSDVEKDKLKKEIAIDKGWVTEGASSFALDEEGVDFAYRYLKDNLPGRTITNFFTGEKNGYGADGEPVVIPDKVLAKRNAEEIEDILFDSFLSNTEKLKKITSIIENNQQTLYNNIESESGTNENSRGIEQDDKRRVQELFKEYQRGQNNGATNSQELRGNQIQQNVTESTIKQELINYADKYQKNNLTEKENKLKNIINNLGGDVIFYEYGNENFYQGLANKEKFYIDTLGESSIENVFYHELTHYLRQNNNKIYNNEIQPIVNEIASDYNYQEAIFNYANSSEDFDIRNLDGNRQLELAEEVVADYVASFYGDLQVNYGLPAEKEQQIRSSMDKILNVNDTQESKNNTYSIQEKILNPTEISQLTKEDANTTPKLSTQKYAKGNKQSSFFQNITIKSRFLNEDFRSAMKNEENIEYYKTVTNKETLENAYNKLNENGQQEVVKWHSKDSKNATAEDVAEGWILLKQYQDSGDYQSAVEVAKKMRDMGTKAGQAVQAYNILSRLTPEGMFYYAQGELSEAYNKMVQGKSKKWIENNRSKFELTPNETQNILDIMQDVSTMEDGYNKKVKLAEIQKIITDKIPPTAGQSIKSWMRISMLFNPKTQVRNIAGNATILPVNMFSDSVSAGIDKLISKKTGIRTMGNTNVKEYAKGFKKGLFESYNDFKKGINTRNIEGNRFEVSEGRNFKNKGIGKALNRVDNLLSFMLDAGDRGFYEASFTNSINNQLVLNNTTQVNQDMIDIATNEALQRTWQDNNSYTQSVLKIRNILNKVNIKGYGLGDVLIPFAKTPANLTKAIVDYSPAGLVKSLTMDARKFKNSLENGQYTAKAQHDFVQNLGKGTAGSFLYVLGYALAKAGIATGEADEDKDVKNFLKNSLGINSYSIKIGNKSFSYDWAQPIATPLAIMTNYVKYNEKNPDASVLDKAIQSINIGTEQLLQQSFMDSLNTVLNGSGTTLENLSQSILELPARSIPTFSKQIADMVDGTQRTSFEYDKPVQSAINSIKAKIPGLSKTLPASIDTLGNEIKKYGGENNFFNVFINPANTNKGELSKAGQEIYNLYQATGDTTIFPRTAPYYINNKGEKITMDSAQRSKFQTVSGSYVESTVEGLLRNKEYNKLSSEKKTKIINEIISDSYSKAKYDILKIDSKEYEKLRETLKDVKTTSYYDYKFKTEDMKKDNEKINVIVDANYSNKEKTLLYENYILNESDKKYPIIKESGININEYLKYKTQEFSADKKDDGTLEGKSISGSKKTKVWNYIENMDITYTQKLVLYGMEYTLSDREQNQIINYINNLPNKTNKEKLEMLSQFKGFTIYKDGSFTY